VAAAEAKLDKGNIQEAFCHLKGWYCEAGKAASRPCFMTMERQTEEREELYRKVPPPGDPIPINVEPFDINDNVSTDGKIRERVRGLSNGQAGGNSFMQAKDIKTWLRGVENEEDEKQDGYDGAVDPWRAFVALIQAIWSTGHIPQQLLWVIVVLLLKGGGGY
jgi:hypothetical protein